MKKGPFSTKAMAIAALSMTALGAQTVFADTAAPAGQAIGHINQLTENKVLSSTVDPTNGDQNPYGLAIDARAGSATLGDLYVSNFSDKAGTNGAGSTVEVIKDGKPVTFATGLSGPAAIAFSPLGPLWVADFGLKGSDGNVLVTKPNGASFGASGVVTNSAVQGPWGQAFSGPYTTADGKSVPPAFFVTGAQNGTVAAMYGFSPGTFSTSTKFAVLGSGLAWTGSTADDIQGPQGMAWNGATHTLYVTDTADSSVRAFQWYGANTPNQGQGKLVYQGGALKKPVGLAIDPVNGDLLVVNQGNNNLVELALNSQGKAHVAGQVVLDKTPVDPKTGAGSGLFGLAASKDANGNLVVYYTDDNTNTVNELDFQPTTALTWQDYTKDIVVGGQVVASPDYIETIANAQHQAADYVPVYYVQRALAKLGVKTSWNGWSLSVTTAANGMVNTSGLGTVGAADKDHAHIQIDGKVVANAMRLVAKDPASGHATSYVSLTDLQAALARAGIMLDTSNNSFTLTAN